MQKRDIIVIGTSAGGVSALEKLVQALPKEFPAAIFIVLHTPPHSPSRLPEILSRAGAMEAVFPDQNEKIEHGKIYVAPPDHHLLIEKNRVLVKRGPKENRFRPSADALFRSAAYVYSSRVIGIVLTGALDDGTSGLWTIKRMGGIAICQDPQEAFFPEMPQNALDYVQVDYVLKIAEMAATLTQLISEPVKAQPKIPQAEMTRLALEVQIATEDNAFDKGIMDMGNMASFACPSCHGALVMLDEDKRVRYRCHTGHSYTASSLLAGITESVEEKLWQAMRGLEETSMLLETIGENFMDAGDHAAADLFMKKANETAERARIVHDSVFHHERLSSDLAQKKDQ